MFKTNIKGKIWGSACKRYIDVWVIYEKMSVNPFEYDWISNL